MLPITVQPGESLPFEQPQGERFINVRRLSAHKRRSRCQAEYIYKYGGDKSAVKIAKSVYECGDSLSLLLCGENTSTNSAPADHHNPCRKILLCPLCAIKRAGKAIYTYKAKYEIWKALEPDLKLYYVVLTVKDGPDLEERFNHLVAALKTLLYQRRMAAASKANGSKRNKFALKSVLADVVAGAYSIELKRGAGSGDWHPHANLLLLTTEPIYKMKLKAEWQKLTGDSFITYVAAKKDDDKDKAFIEIFKYALKFSAMSFADTWHAYNTLQGKRLFGSFGLFRGLNIDDDSAPEDDVYCKLLYTYHSPFYNLSHIKYY